jgi:hypothetical protein
MDTVLFTEETTIDQERVGFAIAQRGADWYAARYVLPVDSTEAEAEQLRADVGHSLLEQMKV